MDSKHPFGVAGRHYSLTLNQNVDEKLNLKTQKLVEIGKGTCNICGRNKSQIFTI